MSYLLTTLLYIFGVGFHVMKKILELRALFPQLKFKEVWETFFLQEWDSLSVSGLALLVCETFLFIILSNHVKLPVWVSLWGQYAIAITLGYAGQSIFYKYLQTAADVLEKKAEQINTFTNGKS